MRSLVAFVLVAFVPISLGAFVACGPPGSFDNITGAPPLPDGGADSAPGPLVGDPSLDPPRPIAPLSASWINGSRPHFKWELGPAGSIGARVEVCPDYACADPSKNKTFSAAGRELTAPEDLAPGLWFWRLVSTTASTFGTTKKGPTWSMLVRGGHGAGVPAGQFVDPNGDGIPDLLVSAAIPAALGTGTPFGYYLFFGTSRDDPTALQTSVDTNEPAKQIIEVFVTTNPNAAVEATDVDGDGASDLVLADVGIFPPATTAAPFFDLVQGAHDDLGLNFDFALARPVLPALDMLPSIVAPGDIDADGHGDLLASTTSATVAFFGATDGLATLTFFDILGKNQQPGMTLPLPTSPIAETGIDYDSDGIADFVSTSYYVGPPFTITRGLGKRMFDSVATKFADGTPVTTPPTAYTSGDIDGDGKNDLVFVTTVATKPSVCVFGGSEAPLLASIACFTPDPLPAGFASKIVTADLDGDGKDEILVGSSAGVDVLTRPTATQLVAEHLAIDHGAGLTVVHPGAVGTPAIWAATRTDGASFALYRGKAQARVVLASAFPTLITKFGIGIR